MYWKSPSCAPNRVLTHIYSMQVPVLSLGALFLLRKIEVKLDIVENDSLFSNVFLLVLYENITVTILLSYDLLFSQNNV